METSTDRRGNPRGELFVTRRRYPRASAEAELFYEADGRMSVGPASDLSLRGVFFASKTTDTVGTRAVVRLSLPGTAKMIRAEAEVVREGPDGMALAFRSMDDADRALLAAFLLRTLGLPALPQLDRRFGELVRADLPAQTV